MATTDAGDDSRPGPTPHTRELTTVTVNRVGATLYRSPFLIHVRHALSRRRRSIIALAALYPLALAGLWLAESVARARSGPLALAAVLAPYLFLPLIPLFPLMMLRGTAVLRLAVVACLLFGIPLASGPPAVSPIVADAGVALTLTTWNVAFGHADREAVRRFVEARPADIVVLEEEYTSWWDPNYARWQAREADLARVYPYQVRRHS